MNRFIEQNFDPIRHMLEHIPDEGVNQGYFDNKVYSCCNLLLVCKLTMSWFLTVFSHGQI